MKIDYEKAYLMFKGKLRDNEQYGNMLQQSMSYAFLEVLEEIEKECIIK